MYVHYIMVMNLSTQYLLSNNSSVNSNTCTCMVFESMRQQYTLLNVCKYSIVLATRTHTIIIIHTQRDAYPHTCTYMYTRIII